MKIASADFTTLLRARLRTVLGEIPRDDWARLLEPSSHDTLLEHQRARGIIGRVRLIALLFAVLTPFWIAVDWLVFPRAITELLAGARLLTSLAFLALALNLRTGNDIGRAWIALGMLFAIPTVFYVFTHTLLAGQEMDGAAQAVAAGYAFLPFVMMAGLSVFPLTALEAAVYSAPLLAAKGVLAYFDVQTMEWSAHFSSLWLLGLITLVATSASMSQLHFMSQLVERSSRDPLTGCINRAHGEELLKIQAAVARRQKTDLTIAFIDLDRFKAVNDVYGHDIGDAVLYQAASGIRRSLRSSDQLLRWGGEEFLILFPGTPAAGAEKALSRLLASGLGRRPDGGALTASAGVAELFEPASAGSVEEMLQVADQRMYEAKAAGGGRVQRHDAQGAGAGAA